MELNRRSLIRNASLLAAGNFLGFKPFGMLNSLAQTTSSYKALVCVFLFGGNDANNTIIPFDTAGYTNYAANPDTPVEPCQSCYGGAGTDAQNLSSYEYGQPKPCSSCVSGEAGK